MDNSEEFRCISLCSGYAGLELGLKRAVPNLRTVCYVEIEAFACANLAAKIEAGLLDAAPIWTDLKTFDGTPFHKRVHIVTAGYPCQPFSTAGKRKGTADPRHLWPYIERIIQAVQPVWCFFENVSGHLSIGYPAVYRSLRNLGYKVETGLFTAAEVGAPHKRERLFILACRSDSRCEDVQIQQAGQSAFRHSSKLADADRKRPKESRPNRLEPAQPTTISHWPARPGQPQYEWEEPRVVANAKPRKQRGRARDRTRGGKREQEETTENNGRRYNPQAQSGVGRAVNGTASRVDRLRLLGNGVVPRQAELAFRVLISTLDEANR